MAKTRIPYERVKQAAIEIHGHQEKITNRAVRAISGGSRSTVSMHLQTLAQEHPEQSVTHRATRTRRPPASDQWQH